MQSHEQRKFRLRRLYLWSGLALAAIIGAAALVKAAVPHTFADGETLTAANLNANFAALDAREPFAGTYPAVLGLGVGAVFCGAPPTVLTVSGAAPVAPNPTYSNAFGSVVFTNGGAVGVNLSQTSIGGCATQAVCPPPLTFYLKSAAAGQLTLNTYLDNAGAIYINGAAVAGAPGGTPPTPLAAAQNTTTIPIPQGSFALSFLACSTDGASFGVDIYDAFISNPANGLTVDYDRTFHRGGM